MASVRRCCCGAGHFLPGTGCVHCLNIQTQSKSVFEETDVSDWDVQDQEEEQKKTQLKNEGKIEMS
jgi:hypothetical protein